jgi:hypothetical protein
MEIVYIITHLMMALSIITVVCVSLTSSKANSDQNDSLLNNCLSTKVLKLVDRIVKTVYNIAIGILINYLK